MKVIIFGHFIDGFPIMETAYDREEFYNFIAYYEKMKRATIDAINVNGTVPAYVRDWLAEHEGVRLEG